MAHFSKSMNIFQKSNTGSKETWDRYFAPRKVIRDLAHGYVRLTEFELEIIDKAPFQRLKDIRQLTCQQVYPAARHTRFEHSLGVMELTRRAIDSLNENGILTNHRRNSTDNPAISDFIRFNATLAALLHDVGHCPFSHLGETQFDPLEVWHRLRYDVHNCLGGSVLDQRFQEKKYDKEPDKGAVHEHLSCIVVLEHFYEMLKAVSVNIGNKKQKKIRVDFELLIRCILGIEYDVNTSTLLCKNRGKNAAIRLINSTIFDMDKLDYIIRDSLFTGIGAPTIDTERLFRNMHLSEQYSLIFTSKAVPVLQNMIEARDNLYMYVYNHHTAVFSDFMFSYIQRRMDHNACAFYKKLYPSLSPTDFNLIQADLAEFPVSRQGLVLKPYLFSSNAIVHGNRSDSDWLSLVNVIYIVALQNLAIDHICTELKSAIKDEETDLIIQQNGTQRGRLFDFLDWSKGNTNKKTETNRVVPSHRPSKKQLLKLAKQIKRTYSLVDKYQSRQFLKPWWKTIYEFQSFMSRNFYDDNIRKQLCDFIYKGGAHGLPASEFRSQLAKHVKYITYRLHQEHVFNMFLDDDDFFVVERSIRFFDQNTIEKLDIALQTNEIVGVPIETINKNSTQEYYIKNLTSIIPQKDYSSLYGERSFYIYSRDFSCDVKIGEYTAEEAQKFNRTVEQIFVFTAEELIRRGEQDFVERFCCGVSKAEEPSMADIFKRYRSKFLLSPIMKGGVHR